MDLFAQVTTALGLAIRLPDDPADDRNPDFDPAPFWVLLSIFEQLILAPKPPSSKESINQLIKRRINSFTLGPGHIREFYIEAHLVDNMS